MARLTVKQLCTQAKAPMALRFRCGDGLATKGVGFRLGKQVYAYVNRCPHQGTELDWVPGQVFDHQQRFLICATHGALFEPSSGRCVAGPCKGTRLTPIPLTRTCEPDNE